MAKRSKKNIEKVKKKHPIAFIVVIALFAVGIFGGYFTVKTLTKNDTFELIGEKYITLTLGQSYQDEGVKVIFFGKDVSGEIVTENTVDFSSVGQYYIKYEYSNFLYKDITIYRYVTIISEEVADGE